SDQLENLKPALTEEDILPVEPEEIAAAQGVTQPVAPTPNTPEEITEPETANPDLQEPDDQLASPEGQNTAFLPRPKPSQQTSAPSEPQADPQQPASAAPQTLPVQNEPVELTEEERLKQERLADAEDYISVGRLIIEDHPGGAVVQYQKALDVYKEYGTEQQLGNAYHELGLASLRAGELDDATKYTLTALKTGQQLNDQLMITRALTNLGFIYMNKRDPANALIYYNQALAEAEGARPSLALAMLQENIAYAYGAEGKKAEAVAHLSEALSIAAQLETDEDPELKEAVDALVNRVNTNIKDYR
ncbi:MAG: tetratricopeptide repeat protein, partial [Alphaproteobacteria bacterium]